MKLLIKIPTMARGYDWLKRYTDNIVNPDTLVLLTLDMNAKVPTLPQNVICNYSQKVKITAINKGLEKFAESFDIFLIGSDDMHPQVKGFDQVIIDDMQNYYPDGDGCLWYNDSPQRRVCTLACMGTKYYKRFGYVYHPSYKSLWCDNEFTDIAKKLDRIVYLDKQIIKHEHPAWGGAVKMDKVYRENDKYWKIDQKTYNLRKGKV